MRMTIALCALLAAATASAEEVRVRQPLPPAELIAALPADGGPEFNRLVFETSPYLRQHARNPVDWYPWGEEAFAKARAEDKPVFLSVGYSTCHWCHVMEHESFEDATVAALLAEHYVCIKVDREERPDLDGIYMSATQLLTGRGGWPNSLWLTGDGRPWFAGTYFPREDRGQQPGFKSLLLRLREVWDERRADVEAQAEQISQAIAQYGVLPPAAADPDRSLIDAALARLAGEYDARHGGFGGAPKFPPHGALALLLAEHARSGDPALLDMAVTTLTAMAAGGVHDQLGGGFHRYSTDERWFLPHFEKMLYDNAQLLPVYAAAARRTGREDFAAVARGIADWALRDMRDPAGGFHSALDADSEGEEGKFYLWREEEVAAVIGDAAAARFASAYGFEPGGNYHEEASGQRLGTNILYLPAPLDANTAAEFADWRERLRAARDGERIWPEKDDKVLTAWNGLMIAGLARAGLLLDEPAWIAAAGEAADFLLDTSRVDGRLLRSYRDGRAALDAYLDDYAFLAWGLLELHAATGEASRLDQARSLVEVLDERFWDAAGGGYHFTGSDHEALLHRGKDPYDAAIPAGNAVAARVLLRLAALVQGEGYRERAERVLRAFQPAMERAPGATASLLLALGDWLELPRDGALVPAAGLERAPAAGGRSAPVSAQLYLARTSAAPGETVDARLRLVIDAGWHVNAADPGDASLSPTRLSLPGGAELTRIDYPDGGPPRVEFAGAPLRVYVGELWIDLALRVPPAAAAGEIALPFQLEFQACDEARCLPPGGLSLPCALTVTP